MDHRSRVRFSLNREIQCHVQGLAHWVLLYDLSVGGAMLETANMQVNVGESVTLDLFGFTNVTGQIAWKGDRNAGIRFDCPLSDSIIEHLGFSGTQLGFDERAPVDRYGHALQELSRAGAPIDPDDQSGNWLETARPKENRRRQDRGLPDRRRPDRWSVDARAKLRCTDRDSVEGRLADLSPDGCSFLGSAGTFEPGVEVWLKIESLEPWKGVVRWVDADRIGIEFQRALHQSIFEHLARSNPAAICSRDD